MNGKRKPRRKTEEKTQRIRQIRKLKWKEPKQRRERAAHRDDTHGKKEGKLQTKQPRGKKKDKRQGKKRGKKMKKTERRKKSFSLENKGNMWGGITRSSFASPSRVATPPPPRSRFRHGRLHRRRHRGRLSMGNNAVDFVIVTLFNLIQFPEAFQAFMPFSPGFATAISSKWLRPHTPTQLEGKIQTTVQNILGMFRVYEIALAITQCFPVATKHCCKFLKESAISNKIQKVLYLWTFCRDFEVDVAKAATAKKISFAATSK